MSSRDSLLNRIAIELNDPEQIHEKIQAQKRTRSKLETAFVAPRTPTEKAVAEIGAELSEEEISAILKELEELSDDEVRALLAA